MACSFQELIDSYSGKHKLKIQKICEPLFQTFGINHFFYQSVHRDGMFHVIGTNPEFMHFYIDQKMHETNPFITNPESLNNGIYLYDSVGEEKFQSNFQLVKEKYRVKHSMTIIENDLECCTQYGFGVSPDRISAESLFINEFSLIREFIKYFNVELSDILRSLRANPAKIEKKKDYLKRNIFPEVQIEYLERVSFLAKLKTPKNLISKPKLSNREIDCLKLYLHGMSASEIGEKLELSKRTIEFHIENVKNKLSCYKKSDVVGLLLQMDKLGLYKDLI